jgi:hypothetical protein
VPSLVLCCVALIGVAFFAMFSTVDGMMRDNDAYRIALAQARADRTVVAALGAPIEPAWIINGQVNTGAGGGHARLDIPIQGPRGRAMLFVEAQSQRGVWKFATLSATIEGSATTIDLRPGLPADRRLNGDEASALQTPEVDSE